MHVVGTAAGWILDVSIDRFGLDPKGRASKLWLAASRGCFVGSSVLQWRVRFFLSSL